MTIPCPDVFPDDLFIKIGAGDLELGKLRVESLITGVHLSDCPDCLGISIFPPRKLTREFIWNFHLSMETLDGKD